MKTFLFLIILGLFGAKMLAQIDSDSLQQAIRLLDTIHATRAYKKYVDQKIFDYTYGCRDTTTRRNRLIDSTLVEDAYRKWNFRWHDVHDEDKNIRDSINHALAPLLAQALYPDTISSETLPQLKEQKNNFYYFAQRNYGKASFFVINPDSRLIYFNSGFKFEGSIDDFNFYVDTQSKYIHIFEHFGYTTEHFYINWSWSRITRDIIYPCLKIKRQSRRTFGKEQSRTDINFSASRGSENCLRYMFDYLIQYKNVFSGSFLINVVWGEKDKILRFAENPLANPDDYDTMTAKIVALNESNISLFIYAFYQEIREILTNPKTHELRKTVWVRHLLGAVKGFHHDFLKSGK